MLIRIERRPPTHLLWKAIAKTDVVPVNPATLCTILGVLLVDARVKKKTD
jgi:hypothetical protein